MAKGKRRAAPIIDEAAYCSYDNLALSIDTDYISLKSTIDAIDNSGVSSDKIFIEGENISLIEKIKQMESKKKKRIKKITVRF